MSDEDLELLITLDDPEGAPEEDTFHHRPAENYQRQHAWLLRGCRVGGRPNSS
jgi:hypothetical protein